MDSEDVLGHGDKMDSDSDDEEVFEGGAGGPPGTRPPRERVGEPWGPFFIARVRESRVVGVEVLKVHFG